MEHAGAVEGRDSLEQVVRPDRRSWPGDGPVEECLAERAALEVRHHDEEQPLTVGFTVLTEVEDRRDVRV
jgi:hypothetical protein